MNDIDRDVRRKALKPLVRRPQDAANQNAFLAALKRLDKRALARNVLEQIREVFAKSRVDKTPHPFGDPVRAAQLVALAQVLYEVRSFSRQEYVFYSVSSVEGVRDERWTTGAYNGELNPINAAIDAIQRQYGLAEDEDWSFGEGPEEFWRLNEKYDAVLDRKFLETLREFGLNDLADLKEQSPEEFDRLHERGRRSVFHRDEQALAIQAIVVRYEQDARRAASVSAYTAAITSLGAGVEGLLLLRCLASPFKASRIAKSLPKRIRPRDSADSATWTFDVLIKVCLKGNWLPPIETCGWRCRPSPTAWAIGAYGSVFRVGRHNTPTRGGFPAPWRLRPVEAAARSGGVGDPGERSHPGVVPVPFF